MATPNVEKKLDIKRMHEMSKNITVLMHFLWLAKSVLIILETEQGIFEGFIKFQGV